MIKKLYANIKGFFSDISLDCIAVCVYFVCMPFTMVTTPFGSLLKVITMPVVAILGVKLFIGKTKPLNLNAVHFAFGAYVIFCFCQLIYFNQKQAPVIVSDMAQAYMVMLLVSLRIYNKKEQQLIEDMWIIVGMICVYLCLTSQNMVNEYENRTIVYILGCEEDPNQYSAYFTMSVVVAIKRIINKTKLTPFYAALLMLIIYSTLKLGSRGGLIGILAGAAACVIFGAKSFKSKVIILLAGAVVAVMVVLILFPLLPEDVQSRYTVQDVVETGGAGRTDIWKFCIQYTVEKPTRILFGSGILSTEVIFPTTNQVTNIVAHNQYIQSFFDQGIIGLSLYILMLATGVLRNVKKQPFYAAALVAMMAFSMSLTMYVLKPYINVLMMCALNIEENCLVDKSTQTISERKCKDA